MMNPQRMSLMQCQVHRFMKEAGQIIGEFPAIRDAELRAKLIEEEAKETCDALRAGNLVEAIDGICDLLYVVFGAANALGIETQKYFDIVHYANMTKFDGPKREDGKQLKPEGWQPPEPIIATTVDEDKAIWLQTQRKL